MHEQSWERTIQNGDKKLDQCKSCCGNDTVQADISVAERTVMRWIRLIVLDILGMENTIDSMAVNLIGCGEDR